MIKDRPTLKTEFSAGQKSYITKLARQFENELAKPELFVFKKVAPEKAAQLRSSGFKTANNVVPIRAPYGAKVRIGRETITVENIFEKNTIFLTNRAFTQTAQRFKEDEEDEELEYDDDLRRNYWRFADGADISSKLYANWTQALDDIKGYPKATKPGKLEGGALPVFSQQKMSGLTGFNADDLRKARQAIIEQIPKGTVRTSGHPQRKAKKQARKKR